MLGSDVKKEPMQQGAPSYDVLVFQPIEVINYNVKSHAGVAREAATHA